MLSPGPTFPGSFPPYAASVFHSWSERRDRRAAAVVRDLSLLGLTRHVSTRRLNDAQIELRVGRTPTARKSDTVSIADVGVGVSQILPLLVALHVAEPGQVVHVEQPEIHLHPNAQVALADVLLEAAARGVRVVAETHSAVLLKAVQVAVAEQRAHPDLVKLH